LLFSPQIALSMLDGLKQVTEETHLAKVYLYLQTGHLDKASQLLRTISTEFLFSYCVEHFNILIEKLG
jgi:hypothetical protein